MLKNNKDRVYKFYREDFGNLPVRVQHMDLEFDVYDDKTIVNASTRFLNLDKPLKRIVLNAKNLDVKSVTCDKSNVSYNYDKDNDSLIINFDREISPDTRFIIKTTTICKPTSNVLEGLYYDRTPAGQPPTQITQCQQWGFQRIVPCLDDMTAKCTYTTKIIADSRYTHLITNGEPTSEKIYLGNGRCSITYNNTLTPMSHYLFFLGVGTYDCHKKVLEYPDGKIITLELLLYPGTDKVAASKALQILHDSILWVHIFTGQQAHKDIDKRNELYSLIKNREMGDKSEELLSRIKFLSSKLKLGYEYTGKIYREIAMQNSDIGGMENVGNTTIIANRIVPYSDIIDPRFEYMIRVKTHEFYHNINGSEVTGISPFEIWLNEAVTVHIERKHHAWLFGQDYHRLDVLHKLISPLDGVLLQDSGLTSMPIEPVGFNDTNELITHITYIKAPEFINMLEKYIGEEAFNLGLNHYYSSFKHSNASRFDWISSMEKFSSHKLDKMSHDWLTTTSYPKLIINKIYDKENKRLVLIIKQRVSSGKHRVIPLHLAVFDNNKEKIHDKIHSVKGEQSIIVIDDIKDYSFISINRGHTAYSHIHYNPSNSELVNQALFDDDGVNKFMALHKLLDREKIMLINNPNSSPTSFFVDLLFKILSDKNNYEKYGGHLFTIHETVSHPSFSHDYKLLHDIKKKIFFSIASKYKEELLRIYNDLSGVVVNRDFVKQEVSNIKRRQVRNTILMILSTLDSPDVLSIIKEQYFSSTNASDKLNAFIFYINSSASDKELLINDFKTLSSKSLITWENFLVAIGSNNSDDAVNLIRSVSNDGMFNYEQVSDHRSLFETFVNNKKVSLQTPLGRELLEEVLIKLSKINEVSTSRFLKVLGNIDDMPSAHHSSLVSIIINLLSNTSEKEHPSVYNTAKKILKGLKKANLTYEKEVGKIII